MQGRNGKNITGGMPCEYTTNQHGQGMLCMQSDGYRYRYGCKRERRRSVRYRLVLTIMCNHDWIKVLLCSDNVTGSRGASPCPTFLSLLPLLLA